MRGGVNQKSLALQTLHDICARLFGMSMAVDEYIMWLSRHDYFPANFSVRNAIGPSRYDKIKGVIDGKPLGVIKRRPLDKAALDSLSCASGPSTAASFQLVYSRSQPQSRAEVAEISGAAPKCYLPNTGFKSPTGHLLLVKFLKEGDEVLLHDKTVARVSRIVPYPRSKEPYELTVLKTSQGNFEVSSSHRITVSDMSSTRRAHELHVGDHVFVGGKRAPLLQVIKKTARTDLYMISFEPDGPVEAFPISGWGLQTRGEPSLGANGEEQESQPDRYQHLTLHAFAAITEDELKNSVAQDSMTIYEE